MPRAEVNGQAINAVIFPDRQERPLAHVDDALVTRVVVENSGDRKTPRTFGRAQLERLPLPDALLARETLRDDDARLLIKAAHNRRIVAVEKSEPTPLAAANHRDRDAVVADRQIDLAERVDCGDRWMCFDEFDRVGRDEG